MLQTEKFILSLTIPPKQIENKTSVPSARQQKKKTVFKLTELILDEGWSGHKSDDTYRDFNKSTYEHRDLRLVTVIQSNKLKVKQIWYPLPFATSRAWSTAGSERAGEWEKNYVQRGGQGKVRVKRPTNPTVPGGEEFVLGTSWDF